MTGVNRVVHRAAMEGVEDVEMVERSGRWDEVGPEILIPKDFNPGMI